VASIDLVDECFVVAPPATVAARFADPAAWPDWWPGMALTVFMDRGEKGLRWSVAGELTGSTEVWCEAWHDGTIVHWYLRVDPVRPLPDDALRERREALTLRWKARMFALKDDLERGRRPGTPAGR
jgi:hypothetical protein